MREHIRREAGQFEAGWWLVPIAFAAAAVAAVALSATDLDASAPQTQAAIVAPPEIRVPPVPAVVPPPAPAEPAYEVEHIQAF